MTMFGSQWFANPGVTYEIDQSCRFDSDTPAYLSRTFDTPTNNKIWTLSFWSKICRRDSGGVSIFFGAGDYNGDYNAFYVTPDLKWDDYQSSSWKTQLRTNAVYRDPSAWYHIVWSYDSTPSTPSASSVKLFVNGVQVTSFSTATYPSQNQDSIINSAVATWIGGVPTNGATYYFDGYMAEVVFVDGTALDADSFGETNSTTGQWIPKEISGLTFGNNGFHLDFADSSALGNDVSGNDNDFTSSGLAAADQMTDSPTDNQCTINPLNVVAYTLSDGNLVTNGVGDARAYGTIGFDVTDSDGFYFEAKVTTAAGYPNVGIRMVDELNAGGSNSTGRYWFRGQNGNFYNPSGDQGSYGDTWAGTADKVIGCLVKAGSLYFSVDGTVQDSGTAAATGLTGYAVPTVFYDAGGGTTAAWEMRFAANMWSTTPTGYKAISTSNLDEPTIADPSAYSQSTIYTGDGSTQSVDQGGNSTFSPDFVWIKNRDAADNHCLFDTVRGATKLLSSNNTDAESTDADTLTAFDSDGFTVGADVKVNTNTEKYVGWQWLESATPGFDIVTDTGTGSAHTISHSLGVTPELIIRKERSGTGNWHVYHKDMNATPEDYYMALQSTGAAADDAGIWNDTAPTSSVFTVGSNSGVNGSDDTYVTYLWAGVESFSKFGSYEGNGNADGSFIWCGFKPSLIICKSIDSTSDWFMFDNKRLGYNVDNNSLFANSNAAELTADNIDILSSGFKLRIATDPNVAETYVFMAWGDTPFKTATAR